MSMRRRRLPGHIVLGMLCLVGGIVPGHAQETHAPETGTAAPLRVYAAGSLKGAFDALLNRFGLPPGALSTPTYGPSGALRARIEGGAPADLFASADMTQPRRLAEAGRGTPVVLFARNRMCAVGRASLGLTPANLLDRMLDPAVKLATSTPGADPSGDYAWAVFDRAEQVHPGAKAVLEGKAQKLMGAPGIAPLVPGKGLLEGIFLSGRADMMLSYCSGLEGLKQAVPDIAAVTLPPELDVGPAYGMTLISDNPQAARFALFVVSEPGQAILGQHGLLPVALPSSGQSAQP
jgi:molybdate transport system substrate-binding protein